MGRGVRGNSQFPTLRHRLASIQDQVQQRLLDEVAIDVHGRRNAVARENQMDFILARLRLRQGEDLAHQGGNFGIGGMNLHGPGEIQKGFDHAIEAANLLRQDFHLGLHPIAILVPSRAFSTSSCSTMAFSGFLTSCATPDISRPIAASLVVESIWSSISARDPCRAA